MIKLFSEIPNLKGDDLVLRQITRSDADQLRALVSNDHVYRYLPTFLFERRYKDIYYVIDHLYTECFEESIILGIYRQDRFCGLAEMYGYKDSIHKISVGYRLQESCWGKGIAAEALRMMIEYLYTRTDIEIITASTMAENRASARVLQKTGFDLVVSAVEEDWGYPQPTIADKWIR